MIIMAWCREEQRQGKNLTAVSVQEVEVRGKTYYMAAVCETPDDETEGDRAAEIAAVKSLAEEAAERMTEWFYREFAGRRFLGKKCVLHRMETCALKLLGSSARQKKEQRRGGRTLSLEWILVRGRRVFYCHAGEGSCCLVRGKQGRLLIKPGASYGQPVLALKSWRRRKSEGWMIGNHAFMQAWPPRRLGRIWSENVGGQETGEARMREMRDKLVRDGVCYGFAAVATWMDKRD